MKKLIVSFKNLVTFIYYTNCGNMRKFDFFDFLKTLN